MMGTLAAVLAGKDIPTDEYNYRAEVKGDIEDVNGVLKITTIQVNYYLKVDGAKRKDAENALQNYLPMCPAAQSVIGCIKINHKITFE
jgi:hypothetical protein